MTSFFNQQTIYRIFSSIIYSLIWIYVIIADNNTSFLIFILTLAAGSLYELVKIKSQTYYYFRIGLIIYVIMSFFSLIAIYNLHNGKALLLILCFQVWSNDVGGYIVGNILGKNKLSNISPHKTWEGVIGSFIFCLITGKYFKSLININIETNWIILCLAISTACILGDLVISKLKRISNQKDSGVFLPGHGGFLDRLDSLFLSILIYYFIICI
jgi:phosphatidate cytidylyltransferase